MWRQVVRRGLSAGRNSKALVQQVDCALSWVVAVHDHGQHRASPTRSCANDAHPGPVSKPGLYSYRPRVGDQEREVHAR